MFRRIGAFASALLLLNVSAAEALRVCALPPSHAPTVQHHQAPADQGKKDCEAPKSTECCSALSSCGATLVIDGARDDASVIPDREVASIGDARAPAAQVPSPDPPPPKA